MDISSFKKRNIPRFSNVLNIIFTFVKTTLFIIRCIFSPQLTHLKSLMHVSSLWPVSEHLAHTSLCLHLLVTRTSRTCST